MSDGIPANTNPFVVLVRWTTGDPKFHNIAPDYFQYDEDVVMPVAKEIIGPTIPQDQAEQLVRKLFSRRTAAPLAVHKKFAHIIPKDLRAIVRVATTYSNSHSKTGFFVPCCTEDECRYLK